MPGDTVIFKEKIESSELEKAVRNAANELDLTTTSNITITKNNGNIVTEAHDTYHILNGSSEIVKLSFGYTVPFSSPMLDGNYAYEKGMMIYKLPERASLEFEPKLAAVNEYTQRFINQFSEGTLRIKRS